MMGNKSFAEILAAAVGRSGGRFSTACDDGTGTLEVCGAIGMDTRAPCLFASCPEEEARILLGDFIRSETPCGYNLLCQLSRLLLLRGALVRDEMERIIRETDWSSYDAPSLLLSFLPHMPDGEKRMIRLAGSVPEDNRDGYLLACLETDSKELDLTLMSCFRRWFSEPGASPECTGELGWLERFIKKWLPLYPFDSLEGVVRLFFAHCAG